MKTGLRCIGFGALMYFFDFNVIVGIRSVDVFPDIVGAFLIIVGAATIGPYHSQFKQASVFAVIGGVGEVLVRMADTTSVNNLGTLFTLASPVAFALAYGGIAKLARRTNAGRLATEASLAAWLLISGAAVGLIAFFATIDDGTPAAQVTLLAPGALLLVGFFVGIIWLITIFFRAASSLKDVPLEEAAL